MNHSYPLGAVVAVWTVIGVVICYAAITQRQQRLRNHLPYSLKDALLLILAAIVLAAVVIYLAFTESPVLNSRIAGMTIVIAAGAVLTYLLNRQRPQG